MSDFAGLDAAMIDTLLSNTRARNTYGPKTLEFATSDEAGVNVREAWPEFKNKKVTALYQGFLGAVKNAELTNEILVKQYDGQVYLLHKERAGMVVQTEVEADEADTTIEADADIDFSTVDGEEV